MQVWQTPARQDNLTGTSHASASSSKLPNFGSQEVVIPLRTNATEGPDPGGPFGRCGARATCFKPGVIASREPKVSVCTLPAGTPQFLSPSCISRKNDEGPHR